jgi:hypothetical protein
LDLLALLRLMTRRWIVVVPILLVTVVAVGSVTFNRGADYMMRGSYMLVAAGTANPADQLDPTTAAEALEEVLQQPSLLRDLEAEGLSSNFTVTLGDTGTTLRVVVSGDSARVVTDTATRLVELAPHLLRDSLGADADTIDARALTEPSEDDVSRDGDTFKLAVPIVVQSVPVDSGNPFPATSATVQSLISLAASVNVNEQIAVAAPGATYLVTNVVSGMPLIEITVSSPTASAAVIGYREVVDQLTAALDRLQTQNGVNANFRTGLVAIVEPPRPQATPSSVIRPAAGIVILGTGVAVALAVLAESVAAGRQQRRRASRLAEEGRLAESETDTSDDPSLDPGTVATRNLVVAANGAPRQATGRVGPRPGRPRPAGRESIDGGRTPSVGHTSTGRR